MKISYQEIVTSSVSPATTVVDDAVGVGKRSWYVAIVNHNSEKKVSERLDKLNVKNYLPTQTEFRVWKNGRKAKVDRVVIPSIIFIHCTEQKRRELLKLPYIFRFMTNRSASSGNNLTKPLAIVSDNEINRLKFMLGQSDVPVTISDQQYAEGDTVRVIRGSLAGLEGKVLDVNSSQSEITVRLEYFGCAKLIIDTVNLEIVR